MKKLVAFLLFALVLVFVFPRTEATQHHMWSYAKGEITKSYSPWLHVLYDTVKVHVSRTVALGGFSWSNLTLSVAVADSDTVNVTVNSMKQRSGGHLTWPISHSLGYGDTLFFGPQKIDTIYFSGGHGGTDSTLLLYIKAVR